MSELALELVADEFARVLQRSVTIDDLYGRILAWELLDRRQDETRVKAVFSKNTDPEARSWERVNGAFNREYTPCVIPANASIGYLSRIAVPLTFKGQLLAYAWVLARDESDDLSQALADIDDLVEEVRTHIADFSSTRAVESVNAGSNRHLFGYLDGGHDDLDLVWGRGFPPSTLLSVVVARLPAEDESQFRNQLVLDLTSFIRRTGRSIQWNIDRFRLVIVSDRDGLNDLLSVLSTVLSRWVGVPDLQTPKLGVSRTFDTPSLLLPAFHEAVTALQAQEVDDYIGSSKYEDIGVYQFFRIKEIYAGAKYLSLKGDSRGSDWVEFLERVYEANGTLGEVATALKIHRSTLYGRLQRISRTIGCDPLEASARLDIHVSAKSARWVRRVPFV